MMVIDKAGEEVQRVPYLSRFEEGWIAHRVVARGGRWLFMPSSALCFRRDLGASLFPIPELLFRLSARCVRVHAGPDVTNVSVIDEVLTGYRVHGLNGMSTSDVDDATALREIEYIQRTHDGVNARLNELGYEGYSSRTIPTWILPEHVLPDLVHGRVVPPVIRPRLRCALSALPRRPLPPAPEIAGRGGVRDRDRAARRVQVPMADDGALAQSHQRRLKGILGSLKRTLRRCKGGFVRSPSPSRLAADTHGFRWSPAGRVPTGSEALP